MHTDIVRCDLRLDYGSAAPLSLAYSSSDLGLFDDWPRLVLLTSQSVARSRHVDTVFKGGFYTHDLSTWANSFIRRFCLAALSLVGWGVCGGRTTVGA